MGGLPRSLPVNRNFHDDDIYCADPNCVYCKDLRVAEQQWKKAQEEERAICKRPDRAA
jgi:hypothetical protein